MSRAIEHIHGSSRLRRALGLGLSGAALVGLIYFEGMSARAEAEEGLAEADEAELDEVDELDEGLDEDEAAEINVPKPVAVALPPSGAAPIAGIAGVEAPAEDTRLAMATVADGTMAAAADMPTEPPAPALVAVPDLKGKSLRKAKKQLAAMGLQLSVRDEYNQKIPREYWSEYRVRGQKIEAGTEVEAGSTVRVKAKMLQRYAQGY